MNRINQLLNSKEDLLTIFYTAGYPNVDDTLSTLEALQENGVDMVEIGIPFSDPVADGPVIQQSNLKAIENGMTVETLFSQLETMRETIDIPVLIMSSLNPILQYGMERFLESCKRVGIDGLILPDLPIDVFEDLYKAEFDRHGIHNILLITPTTPLERINKIDELSTAFIYLVSSSSITGAKGEFSEVQKEYFERIKSLALTSPHLIGFGISDQNTLQAACDYSNGGIIGSAFINSISTDLPLKDSINSFVSALRPA